MNLVFIFAAHAVVSISLTLINKALARVFPFPWLAVLMQCGGCVVLSCCIGLLPRQLKPWSTSHLPDALKLATLFVLCLSSSYYGLERVHVSMVVVGKNLTPFSVAVMEAYLFKTPFTKRTIASLIMSFTGSVLYSLGDTSLEIVGMGFVLLNSLLVALTCVCEKHIVVRRDQTPLGYTLYRNAFAIPFVMIAFASGLEDPVAGTVALNTTPDRLLLLLASNVMLGALNGTIIFELQSRVAATTTQVASLCYKLGSTLLSLLLFPEARGAVSALGWMGYTMSLMGLATYAILPADRKPDSKVKEPRATPRSPTRVRQGSGSPPRKRDSTPTPKSPSSQKRSRSSSGTSEGKSPSKNR